MVCWSDVFLPKGVWLSVASGFRCMLEATTGDEFVYLKTNSFVCVPAAILVFSIGNGEPEAFSLQGCILRSVCLLQYWSSQLKMVNQKRLA